MASIQVTETERVATLSFNRAERRNPLDVALVREFNEELDRLSERSSKGLLVRGNGPVTCAGADLAIVRDGSDSEKQELITQIEQYFETLHGYPRPTVSACEGAGVSAGLQFAVVCDFTVLGAETSLYKPELDFGVYSEWTTRMLEHAFGAQIAREITLTTAEIAPERAEAFGIARRVVPNDAVDRTAEALLDQLLDLDREAYRRAKADLRFDLDPGDCRSYP